MKRCLILFGILCGLSWLVVPTASAATVDGAPKAYPITACSTLSVSSQQVRPGQGITVTGSNFKPNATVRLALKSTSAGSSGASDLGSARTDGSGSFTTTIKLPSTSTGGSFLIYATSGSLSSKSCPVDPSQSLDFLASSTSTSSSGGGAAGDGGGTAFTGLDVAGLVAIGLALLGVGAVAARRGRRTSAV